MLSLSRRLPYISVELAQTYVGAVGFFTAPAVHMCSHNGESDSARLPSHAHERAPIAGYVCSPQGMPLCVVVVAAWVKIVSSQSCVSSKKKGGPTLKSSQTSNDFYLY